MTSLIANLAPLIQTTINNLILPELFHNHKVKNNFGMKFKSHFETLKKSKTSLVYYWPPKNTFCMSKYIKTVKKHVPFEVQNTINSNNFRR